MAVSNEVLRVFVLFLLSFEGFTASTCKFNVKMKQTLRGEGFHRNITYGIVFNSESWIHSNCSVGIDQILPPGVYANPDELGDLRRMKRLNAIPKNRINVELSTEQSKRSSVYLMGEVINGRVYLWLPVHARYHQAVPGGGTARNEIEAPRLYLWCPDQRLEACSHDTPPITFFCNGSSKDKCTWNEIPYTMMTDTLIWEVPVGNTDDYYTVAIGTGVVVTIASLYLLKTIHEYNVNAKKKKV